MSQFAMIALAAIVALFWLVGVLSRPELRQPDFTARAFVIDGDTLAFGRTRVRLFGIDAPEMGQAQGQAAKSALIGLVRGHEVTVSPVTTDRYGRLVARITLPDGSDVAEAMVAGGFARAATGFTRAYAKAERAARAQKRGFWGFGGVQNGARYRQGR